MQKIFLLQFDQDEQNRGNFIGIKDDSQKMTVDDNRGGGGHTYLKNWWRNIRMIPNMKQQDAQLNQFEDLSKIFKSNHAELISYRNFTSLFRVTTY